MRKYKLTFVRQLKDGRIVDSDGNFIDFSCPEDKLIIFEDIHGDVHAVYRSPKDYISPHKDDLYYDGSATGSRDYFLKELSIKIPFEVEKRPLIPVPMTGFVRVDISPSEEAKEYSAAASDFLAKRLLNHQSAPSIGFIYTSIDLSVSERIRDAIGDILPGGVLPSTPFTEVPVVRDIWRKGEDEILIKLTPNTYAAGSSHGSQVNTASTMLKVLEYIEKKEKHAVAHCTPNVVWLHISPEYSKSVLYSDHGPWSSFTRDYKEGSWYTLLQNLHSDVVDVIPAEFEE